MWFRKHLGSLSGANIVHFGGSFWTCILTWRKMAHPKKVQQIAMKSTVRRLDTQPKSLPKLKKKRYEHEDEHQTHLLCNFNSLCDVFCMIWGAKIPPETGWFFNRCFGFVLEGFWPPLWMHFGSSCWLPKFRAKLIDCRRFSAPAPTKIQPQTAYPHMSKYTRRTDGG